MAQVISPKETQKKKKKLKFSINLFEFQIEHTACTEPKINLLLIFLRFGKVLFLISSKNSSNFKLSKETSIFLKTPVFHFMPLDEHF